MSELIPSGDPFAPIIAKLRTFVTEREWEQFHDPKNLAMAVASEAGELLAEYRWVRSDEADEFARKEEKKVRVSHEVADVAIALLLFCDRVGIQLTDAIDRKLAINEANYPAAASRGIAQRVNRSDPRVDRTE
jgi:NTP pyrophosphatase (non-canonical NTP hydrolase)